MYIYVYVRTHMYSYVCAYISIYVCAHIHTHTYIYIYRYTYIWIYIYIRSTCFRLRHVVECSACGFRSWPLVQCVKVDVPLPHVASQSTDWDWEALRFEQFKALKLLHHVDPARVILLHSELCAWGFIGVCLDDMCSRCAFKIRLSNVIFALVN